MTTDTHIKQQVETYFTVQKFQKDGQLSPIRVDVMVQGMKVYGGSSLGTGRAWALSMFTRQGHNVQNG